MRGMTLFEVLIVVIILSILAGMALPRYARTVAHSREAEGWQFLAAIRASQLRYYTEHNEVFVDMAGFLRDDLDIDNPLTLPVPALFGYKITVGAFSYPNFTAVAMPLPRCSDCYTLCLDQKGWRGTGGSCP